MPFEYIFESSKQSSLALGFCELKFGQIQEVMKPKVQEESHMTFK